MAVGYYNFSPIMQGNQTIANSFANLGQQIGQSIENHAQVQAAQALLPALQQSYQNGMQKIATGDPNGLADIYHSASTASQIPILRGFAQNALTTAQSANINAQHMLRTQAYLQGRGVSMMASHPEMFNPDGTFNTSRLGQNAPGKPLNATQQMSAMNNFNKLDNDLATKQADALRLGDQDSYSQLGQQRQALRDTLSKGGLTAPALPAIASSFDNASKLRKAQADLKTEQAKHSILGMGGPDQSKIQNLQNTIKQLQGSDQAKGSSQKLSQDEMLQQAVDAIRKNPSIMPAVKSRLQQNGVDPSLLDAAFKSQQTGQPQTVSQISNMLPAVNSIASNQEPENQDETEAVDGGTPDNEEEEAS